MDKHGNICGELTEIYRKKNHDYGDSFHASFEEFGFTMAAIRLDDKLRRFKNLIKTESLVDESIRDTLMDLANYAIMTVMEMDEKEEKDPWLYNVCCPKCWKVGQYRREEFHGIPPQYSRGIVECRYCGEVIEVEMNLP